MIRVVIVGGGQTGGELAERLLMLGHAPVIVEKDEETMHKLASWLDVPTVHGDGAKLDILQKAGIESSEVLVAATDNDEVNLMATKLAKLSGVDRTVVRVNRGKNIDMLRDIADVTIGYTSATIGLYEKAVTGPEIYGILTLGGKKADVVEVVVSEKSELAGKTIEEIDFPETCTVALITRDKKLIPPRGSTKLKKGDRVILAGRKEEVISVSGLFRGNLKEEG